MTDRELLELAAKAAGELYTERAPEGGLYLSNGEHWTPLTDDGDALRLAVKLGIYVPTRWEHEKMGRCGLNVYEATRKAIVRAAAAIGKGME